MYGGDDIGAVVLDTGSDTIKAGHAGEDTPKAVFSSHVGRIDDADSDTMSDAETKKKVFVARDVQHRRDHLRLTPSIKHANVEDWDGLETLVGHAFRGHLSLSPTDHPLLWSEPTGGSKQQRERMMAMLMESFHFPAVFFCKSVVLSAFAGGRSTALVCESGAGVTTVAPVHEGYVLTKGIKRTKLAGDSIDALAQSLVALQQPSTLTDYNDLSSTIFETQPVPLYAMQRTVHNRDQSVSSTVSIPPNTHPTFHRYQQRELVKDLKESVCRLSEAPFDINGPRLPSVQYELPDGKTLEIGNERFLVPEHFFVPNITDLLTSRLSNDFDSQSQYGGLASMIRASVDSVDYDLHKELYSSLICCGGNTLMTGFASRLSRDLSMDLPAAHKVKIIVGASNSDRKFASWMGGSILASLGTFHQMWVSKSEYEEQGMRIIHAKCP